MKVLIACEFSGRVRTAFRNKGHDAWSCDLLPTEDNSEFHIVGDVVKLLRHKWDLMIAHPPCTYLANSGVRWLYKNKKPDMSRWDKMRKGAEFFKLLLSAPIDRIAVENPIMHNHAKRIIGANQTQIIQPWQFGDGETKAICLWLRNLPPLVPTNVVKGRAPRVHFAAPGSDRWKERSRTPLGIARAMGDQWG